MLFHCLNDCVLDQPESESAYVCWVGDCSVIARWLRFTVSRRTAACSSVSSMEIMPRNVPVDYDIAAFILSKWYTCVQPIDLPPRLDSAPAALECYQVTGLDDLLYSVLTTELALSLIHI